MAKLMARAACALVFGTAMIAVNAAELSDGARRSDIASRSDGENLPADIESPPAVEWGFDVGLDRAHQSFDTGDADLTTVTFAPHAAIGNWELSLDVPWQHAEGGYFVNDNFSPSVEYSCGRVTGLSSAYLARHPLLAKLNQACQNAGVQGSTTADSVSGVGDATLMLRYALALDDAGVWLLSIGGGYKFDNGNAEKNLGSGTRNTLLEASLGASYGWFIGAATIGQAWIDATDAIGTQSNYRYGLVDAGIRPLRWLTLGANWSSDESYYAQADTVQKTSAYIRVEPVPRFAVKAYIGNYGSTEGYPDREVGASIFYRY